MDEDADVQKLLIKKMQLAPDRAWMNAYLDLAQQLLDAAGLRGDDPRLTMSLSPKSNWYFPISINYRYVLAVQREKAHGQMKHLVGLIFAPYCRQIPELSRDWYVRQSWQYDNLRGEISEPPYFLYFTSLQDAVELLNSAEAVWQCCQDALLREVERAKSSSYRRHHQPRVYQAAVDKQFRAEMLDMAFPGG